MNCVDSKLSLILQPSRRRLSADCCDANSREDDCMHTSEEKQDTYPVLLAHMHNVSERHGGTLSYGADDSTAHTTRNPRLTYRWSAG